MGETYLAVRTGAGGFEREVAIKVIRPERAEEPRLRELFLREGKLAGAINHRAVVQVFDVGADDGRFFLVMEHLRGMDLRQLARAQGGRLPWSAAAWVASEAARGLAAAHQLRRPDAPEGLIHGDISPSNLMACLDGAVKVLDFGVARPAGGERSTSGIAGKLAYMPPESANGGTLDHRVDIYSLGVSLYVFLTGVQPFEGHNDFETVQRDHAAAGRPAVVAGRAIPAAIDALVARATARQPSDRFADAAAWLTRSTASWGSGSARPISPGWSAAPCRTPAPSSRPTGTIVAGPGQPGELSMHRTGRPRRSWHLAGAAAAAVLAAIVLVALWARAGSIAAPAGELAPPVTPAPPPSAGDQAVRRRATGRHGRASPPPGDRRCSAAPVVPKAVACAAARRGRKRREPRPASRPPAPSAAQVAPPGDVPPAPPADRPKSRSDDVQPDMPIRF